MTLALARTWDKRLVDGIKCPFWDKLPWFGTKYPGLPRSSLTEKPRFELICKTPRDRNFLRQVAERE